MSVYEYEVRNADGERIALSRYCGKPLLIVNIATSCGLTPQLAGLEKLYQKYRDFGFEVLGFPCDQFLGQNPQDAAETLAFCSLNYGVGFEIFDKIKVNGPEADPLFVYLRREKEKERSHQKIGGLIKGVLSLRQRLTGDAISWNFTKFLIDQRGNVVERYSPMFLPEEIERELKALLDRS
ncbi:MAG: glutathione peroxidase [Peptostreptococcaceae bacterium]|nr:glutathione peroxidase [Peptostreptococcaceae bacterium]